MSLQVAAFSLTGERGRLDEGEKRHGCDREVTMKSSQNEKSNWKMTGGVENSFFEITEVKFGTDNGLFSANKSLGRQKKYGK